MGRNLYSVRKIFCCDNVMYRQNSATHRLAMKCVEYASFRRCNRVNQRLTTIIMADPFEVRMRFTSQLQHLNASVTSSQKAAHYALKFRDMDEDLHSCILEQLERVSISFH